MARTQDSKSKKKKEGDVAKTITSLNFNKDEPIDEDLIQKTNTFCGFKENKGFRPTTIMRKFIEEKLDEEISKRMLAS